MKILSLILVMLLCLAAFCGCNGESNNNTPSVNSTANSDAQEIASENASSDTATGTSSVESAVSGTTSDNTQSSVVSSTVSKDETATSKPSGTTSSNPVTSTPVSNSLLENARKVLKYDIKGTPVEYFIIGDVVYLTLHTPNRLVVLDTNTGELLCNLDLPDEPGDLKRYGDEMWISFPYMSQIRKYDIRTYEFKETLDIGMEVSSFDVYGDYLFFATHRQFTRVFRYNIKTGKSDIIVGLFEADLMVNAENNLIYVSESAITASHVYCYDIDTLEMRGTYGSGSNQYCNNARRAVFYDGSVYWGKFKFKKDMSVIEQRYDTGVDAGMLHVDNKYVVTEMGIFLRNTGECIDELNLKGFFLAVAVTKSENVVTVDQDEFLLYIK